MVKNLYLFSPLAGHHRGCILGEYFHTVCCGMAFGVTQPEAYVGDGGILLNFRQLSDRRFRFTLRPKGLLEAKFFGSTGFSTSNVVLCGQQPPSEIEKAYFEDGLEWLNGWLYLTKFTPEVLLNLVTLCQCTLKCIWCQKRSFG